MKLRFYFDYSDYRSYLMMHTVQALSDLPVQIQWIALDAYSLRALSGCESRMDCAMERDFLQQEAMRFCQREGIEFVWQNERFHNGSALHAGIWLMMHRSDCFESYSSRVLEILWGMGKTVDSGMLKQILGDLDVDLDLMVKTSTERENFQTQDRCLQQAMNDGVFDVPAVVVGDQLICRYDQEDEIRRLVMLECLKDLPQDVICRELSRFLLALPKDVCRQKFDALVRRNGAQQTASTTWNQGINTIQHTLVQPQAIWDIAKHKVSSDIQCNVVSGKTVHEIAEDAVDGAINLTSCELEWTDRDGIEFGEGMTETMLISRIRYQHRPALLIASYANHRVSHRILSNQECVIEQFRGWTIAFVSPGASRDVNASRYSAHSGAQLIVMSGLSSPYPEAFGGLAKSWVVSLTETGVAVVDAASSRIALKVGESTSLNDSYRLIQSEIWNAPAPRTLLLCEEPLTFGELSSHADFELGCRGMNLLVSTAHQSSELSPTRVYEKFRFHNDMIVVLPFSGEQMFVTELVSHRLMETLNQASRDAYPIFINYWNDLEFEMLDTMRPSWSVIAGQYRIPVVIVVGNQVSEIWLPTAHGMSWRIEKDDDCYTIDLAELCQAGHCFEMLLKSLDMTEESYIDRLRQIEMVSRKGQAGIA